MSDLADNLIVLVRLGVAVGFFLLPGWLLGRRLGSPLPLLTTFLGSAAVLLNSVLLADALRIPLNVWTGGLTMLLFIAPIARFAWRTPAPVTREGHASSWRPVGVEWFWVPAVLAAVLSVALRAWFDPLSGFDNWTRWDYLARLMIAQGSLDHYPPVTTHDFESYPWCDGIPPLVSTLNFWLYTGSGSAAPLLTIVRVMVESLLAGVMIFRLARVYWGPQAGWAALGIAATSSLLLWAWVMGQETALTTLSLVALLYLLERHRASPDRATVIWAGIAAGIGALAREYGLAFVLLGAGILWARRSSRADLGRFLVAAVVVAGPWYVRNWIITGNPVFPHTLGGLFPTNPIHVSVMKSIAAYWGVGAGFFNPWSLPTILAILAGPLIVLAFVGLWRAGQRRWSIAVAMAVVAGLWWWSIPSTAAGWAYSTRVLAPALAAGAAMAAWIGTLRPALQAALALLLLPLALDAARRTWVLPQYPDLHPWPYSFTTWKITQDVTRSMRGTPLWGFLVSAGPGKLIIVDHPAHHIEVTYRGGRVSSWFSPAVRPLFSRELDLAEAREQLRAADVRFLSITVGLPASNWFIREYPLLGELTSRYAPNVREHFLSVYDLENLIPLENEPAQP